MKLVNALYVVAIGCVLSTVSIAQSRDTPKPRFKAVAFDYFVIFDPNSIIPFVEKEFPGKGAEFTRTWQRKQFDYAFLRSITGQFKDFLEVTGDAMDYTADWMNISMSADARTRLLNAYLKLKPWPDTVRVLNELRASGIKIITIANFSPRMLRSNADNAGITDLFDELLSTEASGTYKPDAMAYELGLKHLHLKKDEVVFAAFGSWDVYGAKSFGYPTFWVNRFNVPGEKLGVEPDGKSTGLDGLLDFVLRKE